MSTEDRARWQYNISRSRGGAGLRAEQFLHEHKGTFTLQDFNKVAGYKYLSTAKRSLNAWIDNGSVQVIKQDRITFFISVISGGI